MKETKEKKGAISSVLLIIISSLILLVAIVFFIYATNKSSSSNNVDSQGQSSSTSENIISTVNNDVDNEDENDSDTSKVSSSDLEKWVGNYNGDNNVNIKIKLSSNYLLSVSFSSYDDSSLRNNEILCSLEDGKLTYDDTFIDTKTKVDITYKNDTISVTASSSDEEDILNIVDGEYEKEENETLGWTGIYGDGETFIALTEISDDLTIVVSKDTTEMSVYTEDYTEDKVTYEGEKFGEQESISIEKTNDGIKIESSSSDEEDILNETSGEYKKL